MLIWALGVLIAVIVLLPLAWKWELPALLSTGVVVSIGTACGGIGVLAQACRGLPIAGVVVLQALLAPTLFAAFCWLASSVIRRERAEWTGGS